MKADEIKNVYKFKEVDSINYNLLNNENKLCKKIKNTILNNMLIICFIQ